MHATDVMTVEGHDDYSLIILLRYTDRQQTETETDRWFNRLLSAMRGLSKNSHQRRAMYFRSTSYK